MRRFTHQVSNRVAWWRFRLNLVHLRRDAPRLILLQSSDRDYAPFLDVTGDVNREYAERFNCGYASFVGNASRRPKTANFNRYFMLRHVVAQTNCQWAMWMDADAIVVDPTIRPDSIIDASPDKLIIACRGRDTGPHDINNGVFFLNLRHRETERFLRYLTRVCFRLPPRNSSFHSDQRHVHDWLKTRRSPSGAINCVKRYTGSQHDKFNYGGPFIHHALRKSGTFEQRLDQLRTARDLAMKKLASLTTEGTCEG